MSQAEANRATAKRVFLEIVNEGKLDLVEECYTPGFVDHEALPGSPPGSEGLRHTIAGMRTAFPDVEVTIEDTSAHGDYVVLHNTWRGTNLGELAGVPPTGRQVTFGGLVIFRFEDGRIAERWTMDVQSSLLEQLGIDFPTRLMPKKDRTPKKPR